VAVDAQAGAGHQRRLGREQHGSGDLLGRAEPAERDLGDDRLARAGRCQERAGHRCLDERRRDGVDPDPERREFERHRLREALDRVLGGAVDGAQRRADVTHLRAHEHDRATAPGHPRGRRLGGEERAAYVQPPRPVEGVLAHVEDRLGAVAAGARDQHGRWLQAGERGADLRSVGDVARHGLGGGAGLAGQRFERPRRAAEQRHARAGARECERARAAEAAGRAGDDGEPRHTTARPSRISAVIAWPSNPSACEIAATAGATRRVPSSVSRW
jgi:hypothetical protein